MTPLKIIGIYKVIANNDFFIFYEYLLRKQHNMHNYQIYGEYATNGHITIYKYYFTVSIGFLITLFLLPNVVMATLRTSQNNIMITMEQSGKTSTTNSSLCHIIDLIFRNISKPLTIHKTIRNKLTNIVSTTIYDHFSIF